MSQNLLPFLAGAVTMGFFLSGLAFFRLWRRTRDRLFLAFAGAFWLLMVPAIVSLVALPEEPEGWAYLFRAAAYALIGGSILLKNRARLRGLRHGAEQS